MNMPAASCPPSGARAPRRAVPVLPEVLDRLMPMSLIVSPDGHIRHVGPTLARLRPGQSLVGRRLLEVFDLRRPRNAADFGDLAAAEEPVHLQFRDAPCTRFKGHCAVLSPDGDVIVNLSFGIGAVEALAVYDLTGADFAPTDLTVELLYLAEANAAVQTESLRLAHKLETARSRAEELAQTDTLTGLRNRRAMELVLDRYRRAGEAFALMLIDLDFFKAVNDEHGHAAGDHVLCSVASILREETREMDTIVRTGGDEFVLIFPRLTAPGSLADLAGRLLQRLEQPILYQGTPCRISGSIGIVVSTDYTMPVPDMMLNDADAALYLSKKAGRARYCFAGKEGDLHAAEGSAPVPMRRAGDVGRQA